MDSQGAQSQKDGQGLPSGPGLPGNPSCYPNPSSYPYVRKTIMESTTQEKKLGLFSGFGGEDFRVFFWIFFWRVSRAAPGPLLVPFWNHLG